MAEEERSRKRVDKEIKAKALREYYAGRPPKTIIAEYGFKERTFYSWIKSAKRAKEPDAVVQSEDCSTATDNCSIAVAHARDTVITPSHKNYIVLYSSAFEFDKAKLQQSAINGYCEGICRTNDLLHEAEQIEDPADRIYCTLAILKERRCIQDRIIKVFSEITTSSNEYEQMFGKLFNMTEAVDEHRGPATVP